MLKLLLIVFLCVSLSAQGSDFAARTSYCPQWSPDGKSLVFYSQIAGRWRIMTVQTDGSNIASLSEGKHDDFYPSFSPKGDSILFYSNRDGNQEIYTMRADGSGATRLTNNATPDRYPRYSPDGKKIAYVCGAANIGAMCVMNADGSEQTQLTKPSEFAVISRISWSPDGSRIAFYSSNDRKEMSGDNQWALFAVSVATKKIERLDPVWRRDSNPHWSQTTNRLAVDAHKNGAWESEDGNWEIFVMNPDGTGRRNLTQNDARNDWAPSWSPDGKRIAYSSGINDQYEIYIINADGQKSRRITRIVVQ